MRALIEGHRAVDSARDVRLMAAVRVAFHADRSEAERWIEGKTASRPEVRAHDIAEARRASLEALGVTVTSPPPGTP